MDNSTCKEEDTWVNFTYEDDESWDNIFPLIVIAVAFVVFGLKLYF